MKFKQKVVQERINRDVSDLKEFRSWHGLDIGNLQEHLVELRHERFRKGFNDPGYIGLWVVFDERPGSEEGYLVVFCPRHDSYGLATKRSGSRWGSFVGFHGDLQKTLESM